MIKAFIIDDIPEAIEMVSSDLRQYCPLVEIVGTASSVVEGAKALQSIAFDVLFLDIELEDGTGFDLLEIVPEINFKVIFVTASDQHAIKAFRFSAVDYLLKPIDPDELMEAVSKIQYDSKENIEVLIDHWREKDQEKIALHNSDEIKVVAVDDIIRCSSDNNYTFFHFADKTRFLVTKTLKSFDQMLTPSGFYRVHQSHLINVSHIQSYIRSEGGYLVMSDGTHVPVSVRKKAMVIDLLSSR